MRRLALAFAVTALAMTVTPALAQYPGGGQGGGGGPGGGQNGGQGDDARRQQQNSEWNQTAPPLPALRNAGPCPFVRVLYDAARQVEFAGGQEAAAAVGYTGEFQGLTATCEYRDQQPIRVHIRLDMAFGRGPQATSNQHVYRYWVAVTQRNVAVLDRQDFEIPVTFPAGQDRVRMEDTLGDIVIPRANMTVSGANYEILVGFNVTPEQAQFNREGRRFHVNAGQTTAETTPPAPPHP
jgi:hypothetical protein